jgi:hypothetical protein
MSWEKSISIIAIVFLILLSACGPQQGTAVDGGTGQDPTAAIETRVAEIVASTNAAQTAIANAVAATLAAMQTSTPESTFTPSITLTPIFTYTPSLSPTSTFTLTPEFPTVSVSVQTNCRFGPGSAYDVLGIMNVGETAQVVGRNASSDYWIIKLPSNPAITCWLWGKYATVVGNTTGLPVATPPSTPTPKYTPTLSVSYLVNYDSFDYCSTWGYYIKFKIVNNGDLTWESLWVRLVDETAGITREYYGDKFGNLVGCTVPALDDNLEPGETGYSSSVYFTYDPSGHHFSASMKLYSGVGETGTSLEKTLTFTP